MCANMRSPLLAPVHALRAYMACLHGVLTCVMLCAHRYIGYKPKSVRYLALPMCRKPLMPEGLLGTKVPVSLDEDGFGEVHTCTHTHTHNSPPVPVSVSGRLPREARCKCIGLWTWGRVHTHTHTHIHTHTDYQAHVCTPATEMALVCAHDDVHGRLPQPSNKAWHAACQPQFRAAV